MRSSYILRNIGRMLDLGGLPSASTSKNSIIDVSMKLKVRCLAFDFDMLTRTLADGQAAVDAQNAAAVAAARHAATNATSPQSRVTSTILPDATMLQQMANLLNVKLGESVTTKKVDDDLSQLAAEPNESIRKKPLVSNQTIAGSTDIRSKYASRLQNRGGIAGIELAKYESQDALTKGDAAGHLTARAIAVKAGNTSSDASQKWMAHSGTGALLQFLKHRSMKIALLPLPGNNESELEGNRMVEFTKQVPNIAFDVMLKEGESVDAILENLLHHVSMEPLFCLVVSDREDYIRSAKDAGMTTCRVRAHANAPRGNTTAHYTVTSMSEVQDVLNEINGISFKAASLAR